MDNYMLGFYGMTKDPETEEFMMVTDCHKKGRPWCKDCVPHCIIEGWTSENAEIDEFIKDTMYYAIYSGDYPLFLEWVPFDRFEDIKQIGEGGFAKVYSATWIDGYYNYHYEKQNDGSWKKLDPKSMKLL